MKIQLIFMDYIVYAYCGHVTAFILCFWSTAFFNLPYFLKGVWCDNLLYMKD